MPGIVRNGDLNSFHCAVHNMAEGSTGWFVDGKGMVGTGHATTSHKLPPDVPPCPAHTANAGPPDRGWYVDGRLIAANMDGIPGCTNHAQGSPNWFIE